MFLQTDTIDLLKREDEFIDYHEIISTYKRQDLFECMAILILFILLTRFSQLFLDVQIQVKVLNAIAYLILTFVLLWWAYIYFFANVFTYTWGHRMAGYRKHKFTILSVLGSVIMVSNEPRLSFEHEQTEEVVKFFILMIMVIYMTRLCIVCQVTSLIIEQFRKSQLITETINNRYKHLKLDNICSDWLKMSLCCKTGLREKRMKKDIKKRKKKGKKFHVGVAEVKSE